jgi:FMN phosphatase YigB (HAD superfamily)
MITLQEYILFGPLSQLVGRNNSNSVSPNTTLAGDKPTVPTGTNTNPVIPPYLWENIDLWVWDWDDTLIDTTAYVRHSMSRNSIMNLTDHELGMDVPYWQFFRDLVVYLVQNGRRVGIASFGTYTIIRAYMDRIFGRDQKYFIRVNIHAACEDLDCVRDYRQMPLNKNPYIQRMMNHYKITDHARVILFDDVASNIADAKRLGVVSVQMGVYDKENAKWLPQREAGLAGLFGPSTLIQFGDRFAQKCDKSNRVGSSQVFGWIGDRKSWKYQTQADSDDTNRVLNPNFRTSHFNDVGLEIRTRHFSDTQSGPQESTARSQTNSTNENTQNSHIKNSHTQNSNNQETNKIPKIQEGMKLQTSANHDSCMSCQSQTSNYILISILLILILLITWFVKWG